MTAAVLAAGELLGEGGLAAFEMSNPVGWAILGGTALYLGWEWYQSANQKADEQGAEAPPTATCNCPTSTPADLSHQEPKDEQKQKAGASRGPDGGGLTPSHAQGAPTASQVAPAPQTGDPPVPALPTSPDDLLQQGWEETTDSRAAGNSNRRTFRNTQTGQELEFDKATPDAAGFRGQDHYHVPNPSSTGKRDAYLDQGGNPVPDGSKKSHILPDGH